MQSTCEFCGTCGKLDYRASCAEGVCVHHICKDGCPQKCLKCGWTGPIYLCGVSGPIDSFWCGACDAENSFVFIDPKIETWHGKSMQEYDAFLAR